MRAIDPPAGSGRAEKSPLPSASIVSSCAFREQRDHRPPRSYILLLPLANNFSTSSTITSAPANSMFPTRCQRMTPFWSIT